MAAIRNKKLNRTAAKAKAIAGYGRSHRKAAKIMLIELKTEPEEQIKCGKNNA
jgi:hypothetical protein